MSTQPGIQTPPTNSGGGKKWLTGCLIAFGIFVIAAGGLAWWGVNKAKGLAEEWKDNPELVAVAMVLKFDDSYDLVDKDVAAGVFTVKNSETGENSTWTYVENDTEDGSFIFRDEQGRKITVAGKSNGNNAIVVTESSAEEVVEEEMAPEAAPVE